MELPLKGKTALVTGAGRLGGIGASVCLMLAEKGADIFFTYYSPYDGDEEWKKGSESANLAARIREMGRKAGTIELDLSMTGTAPVLFDAAEKEIGIPDILVNNACYSKNDNIESLNEASIDLHYEINVRAVLMLCKEFSLRYKGEEGRIINLTSGQGIGPMTGDIAYAATKGAIQAVTATLAAELAPKKITVNSVNPGPTDTGWMDEDLRAVLLPKFPLGRIGMPEDAARIITFLASGESGWITGQTIHSEGGFLRK
ncbi:SDR family oxidoreductase [Fictibacillus aquaticus]|uniref:Oxidoreductase n=1 Tax=Fictibacillus aquaticus TaxID=2021314 RepID=A0A235F4M9_9BACL|nr:SDR family oxidoreductase [Fictibacillus aquaticus]OYD56221.1 oxidoreductase [Fictibacillus aquaticus]